MAEHASVVRVTHFRAADGKRDELMSRLQSGIEAIRNMEGCYGAQLCNVREMPEVIGSVSRWASQAALDNFLKTTESQRAEVAQLTAEPPMSEHLDSL